MRKVLLLTTVFVLIFTSLAWAADISGTWTVAMKSPAGQGMPDESFDLAIKASGSNLTVTCNNHPALKAMEGTGTLKGDAIKMDLKATGQSGMKGMALVLTGKVTGNKMAGTTLIDASGMSAGVGGAPGGSASGQAALGPKVSVPYTDLKQAPPLEKIAAPGSAPGTQGGQTPTGATGGGQPPPLERIAAPGSGQAMAWTAVKK